MSLLLAVVPWWGRIVAVAAVLVAAAAFGAVKMHEHDQARFDALQAQYSAFVDKVRATGLEAKKAAEAKEKSDKERKEKSDAENTELRANNTALAKRLRDERARSRFVPAAAPGSTSPDRACFGRSELERALQRLDEAVSGLVAEGDAARIDLNTAKGWAKR